MGRCATHLVGPARRGAVLVVIAWLAVGAVPVTVCVPTADAAPPAVDCCGHQEPAGPQHSDPTQPSPESCADCLLIQPVKAPVLAASGELRPAARVGRLPQVAAQQPLAVELDRLFRPPIAVVG